LEVNAALRRRSDEIMIHHIDIAASNLPRNLAFYTSALEPLGRALVIHNEHEDGHEVIGFGSFPDPLFWIRSGQPALTGLHVAVVAPTRQIVDAVHRRALAAGGVCNGTPGLRPRYAEHSYAAFVFDPDGHNIEAVCREAA
jgi:catechol 2,3-dioxygenase-like lactoylglutathione lyase family enzyme